MNSILEGLSIERIAFHKIFKRDISGFKKPVFNDKCETLGNKEIGEIESRVVTAIGNDSKAMKMDIIQTGEGSVYSFVAPFFRKSGSEKEFVDLSKNITNKLAISQNTIRIPGGAVIIFEGTVGVDSNKYVGIIKAEEDNGFVIEPEKESMYLRYISELLLTKNQKIYKVAMLIDKLGNDAIRESSDIEVFIYDSNNSASKAEAKAIYFYDGFLGCAFPKSSNFITKDFYDHTKTFIKASSNFSGESKIDLLSALYTYLKVNTNDYIRVAEFADMYFGNAELKDNYKKYMSDKKIPSSNIKKDISLISNKLKKRIVRFTSGIELRAPSEKFMDLVNIKENENNSTTINIKAQISSEV